MAVPEEMARVDHLSRRAGSSPANRSPQADATSRHRRARSSPGPWTSPGENPYGRARPGTPRPCRHHDRPPNISRRRPGVSVGTPEKRVDGENKMAGGNGGLPGSPEVTVHDFVDRVLGKPPLPPSAHGRKAVERSDRRSGARQDRPVSRDRAERAVRRRSVNPGQGRCRALARLRFAGRPGTGAAPRRG